MSFGGRVLSSGVWIGSVGASGRTICRRHHDDEIGFVLLIFRAAEQARRSTGTSPSHGNWSEVVGAGVLQQPGRA